MRHSEEPGDVTTAERPYQFRPPANLTRCQAELCSETVSPGVPFCAGCFAEVPHAMRGAIYASRRTGLKAGQHPTPAYEAAVIEAVRALARRRQEQGRERSSA